MKTRFSFFKKNSRISLALAVIAALLVFTGALASGGALDPTFGTNGFVITDLGSNSDTGDGVLLSLDGNRIYVIGTTFSNNQRVSAITRYSNNGTLDTGYGTGGKMAVNIGGLNACDFESQSDGKFVLAVPSSPENILLTRYLSDGSTLDTSFGANGIATVSLGSYFQIGCSHIAIQPDHKIVMIGAETTNRSNSINIFVVRFNEDGTQDFKYVLDNTGFPNTFYDYSQAVAIQTDGKIVASGGMPDSGDNGLIFLTRLNADGSPDTAFGTNGQGSVAVVVPFFNRYNSYMALQADGKIVIAGTTGTVINDQVYDDLVVARFDKTGNLDATFGGSGILTTDFGREEQATDVVIQKDGKIVVVGKSFDNTSTSFLLVRYNTNGSLDTTFGANGKLVSDLGYGANAPSGVSLQPDGKLLVSGTSNNNDMLLARYDMGSTGVTPVTKTFTSVAAYDGWILESGENSNQGGLFDKIATTLNVGDDAKNRQYRSILFFNTKSIPDNAFITSVQLKLKRQGLVGTDPFTTHGDLLLDIRDNAFSWNIALQLNDFSAPASQGVSPERLSALALNWYAANLSNANLRFINKVGVTQFRLRFALDDNNDLSADYLKFFSGNAAEVNQPQLIVTYYMP